MDKYYFSHDFNARNDENIEVMLMDYKAAGYGMYWSIVERLHEKDNSIALNDIFYKAVAKHFLEDPEKVKSFIDDCSNKYDLFDIADGVLSCERVGRNIDKRESVSKERSEAGKAGAIAKQLKANAKQTEASAEQSQAPAKQTLANAKQNLANPSKEKEKKENTNTHLYECVCEIFGREYKPPPDRMPALANWYQSVEQQAEKLLEAWPEDVAIRQVKAYLRHCDATNRKKIGTVYKIAETLLSADWIGLNTPDPVPKVKDTYEEASYNLTLWTPEAWKKHYAEKIRGDPKFREHFNHILK